MNDFGCDMVLDVVHKAMVPTHVQILRRPVQDGTLSPNIPCLFAYLSHRRIRLVCIGHSFPMPGSNTLSFLYVYYNQWQYLPLRLVHVYWI